MMQGQDNSQADVVAKSLTLEILGTKLKIVLPPGEPASKIGRDGTRLTQEDIALATFSVTKFCLEAGERGGWLLKRCREHLGLSRQEFADKTKSNIHLLQYVEDGGSTGVPDRWWAYVLPLVDAAHQALPHKPAVSRYEATP